MQGMHALQTDLKRRLLIDGQLDKCKRVLGLCLVCQGNHAVKQVKEGMPFPPLVPDTVMSSVSLDTFHLDKAKGDDCRVYVDCLRGVAIVEPILFQGLEGEESGRVPVPKWLSTFDAPVEITTNHDRKFTSAWFNSLCLGLGVSITYSQVYRSRTNGRAEVEGHQPFLILWRIHLEEAPHGISWLQCIWAVHRS